MATASVEATEASGSHRRPARISAFGNSRLTAERLAWIEPPSSREWAGEVPYRRPAADGSGGHGGLAPVGFLASPDKPGVVPFPALLRLILREGQRSLAETSLGFEHSAP